MTSPRIPINTKDQPRMHVKRAYLGKNRLLHYTKAKCQSTGSGAIMWLIESNSIKRTNSIHSPPCKHQLTLHTVAMSVWVYFFCHVIIFMFMLLFNKYLYGGCFKRYFHKLISNIKFPELLYFSFIGRAIFPQVFFLSLL